ncbi:NADH:flavin oxidoreductase/NADH oxidase family protein [Aestuariibacter halophilus]|uniref:NADH:flavin oxidoreductase/NADH oxidase family protein n=1 Tax=Fluctibacter halophilus TaxID=226011 RepID=A0ABS8G641_9ALTE|nr:NADH:flavin oxidoreductase/NADH oxidase family protein [Aestuariibacter halophilus]MCC2616025.1 NADH:flavin oxidoreductase/NADH oxidase family protein [Aestuariibacter halophilus]
MSSPLFTTYTLPCGQTVKNRLVKAAMEENMAERQQLPGQALFTLYDAWAKGGVGTIITGNVMVDHLAMTGPGGVALEKDTPIEPFKAWAEHARQQGTRAWMQINHPGRQVFKRMGGRVWSPSDVALNMGKHSGMFTQPKPMTEADIEEVIERFVTTAQRAQQAGFDGVQVHAAHGYLLAQFLSPLTNKRSDQWGGSLENRARLLLRIVAGIRSVVRADFAVTVKLNSADFQRGGFDVDDALAVVKLLETQGVDLIELSGGSYEAPAMQGRTADKRTLAREAYFLEFAEQIAAATTLPVMTTGGISRKTTAEAVIGQGVVMAGMASALAMTPDLPARWQQGDDIEGFIPRVGWKDKTMSGLATMALVKRALRRLGLGKRPHKGASAFLTLLMDQWRSARLTKRYRQQYQAEVS